MEKKVHDYEIDKAICKFLLKYERNNMSRRKMKRVVESSNYLGRKLGTRLYEFHIQRLIEAGYIVEKKDEWKRGKKSPLLLTNKTREQLRLSNLSIEFKQREHPQLNSYTKLKRFHNTKEDRFKSELKRNRIYYIIMRVLSIETPNKHYRYSGLSITDITNARYDGHAFYSLRLEYDREMIQECLNNLKREIIVSEIKIPVDGESRYKLVDLRWKSFVTECAQLLEDSVLMRLHIKWKNLRPCSSQERIWYESCWGDRDVNGHLISVYKHYKENQEKSNEQYKEQILDLTMHLDYNINQSHKKLESKYSDLARRCSSVYNMIIETIYPEFLRLEIEKTLNNRKNKDMKYLKLQSARFDDVLTFHDSVQSLTYEVD